MAYASSASRSSRLSDYYLILLSGVLMGYAFIGKGFAYLGLPPIYIGEIALLGGIVIVIFLPRGCLLAALATLPSVLLVATMVWVLLRTVPFFGEYGFDALRDSVVIVYGSFAIIVAALLFEDGRRVDTILRYYGAFLRIFIPAIPFLFAFSKYLDDYIPKFSNNVPMLQIRSGETAVHLAGAVVFALAGFRKLTPLEIILLLATTALVSTGRGAMVAIVLPVIFAVLLLGKVRQSVPALLAGLAIFGAVYAFESAFTDYRTDYRDARQGEPARSLSTRQIVDNVMSIGGFGGAELEDTKQWRLEWWDIILADTVYGPNFWTGRGFGLNLAEADGFTDGDHSDRPPLRSPHSVHMTILARAGVPGAVLWALFLASWFGIVMHAMLTARHRGQTEWAGLFLFICCYVMAIIIDATFDVALEGPMVGIWFWCLVGFGIGSVMVYRRKSIKRTITHRNA